MKKLIVAFCLAVTFCYSQVHSRILESVDIKPINDGTIVTFMLSDNTTWKKIVYANNEFYLHDIEKNLPIGQEVLVAESKGSSYFKISGPKNRSIYVGMTKETKSQLPTIEHIELTQGAGLFGLLFGSKNTYRVHLSDGSIWERSCNTFVKYWKEEDAVFTSQSDTNLGTYLINVDAPYYKWDLNEEKLDKRGWYFKRVTE